MDNDVHLPCFLVGGARESQVVKLRGGGPRVPKEITLEALSTKHRLIDECIRHHIAHMMSFVPESRSTSSEIVEILRKIL